MKLTSWILTLVILSWFAVFSSQSLVDLSDTLVVLTALMVAFRQKSWRNLFLGFRPASLWIFWLAVICVGLFVNRESLSSNYLQDLFEFRWILSFLAWIFLISRIEITKERLLRFGQFFLVLNIIAFAIWLQNPSERAGGIMGSIMAFAHNLAPTFCFFTIMAFTVWSELNKKERLWSSAFVLSSLILVVLTFTRGTWIGSIVGISMATLVWNRKVFFTATAGMLVVFLVGISTSERFYNRVFTKTALEKNSNQERTALWKGNWEMIKESPILGVGLGQNKQHLRKYYDQFGYPPGQRESHAHNQYLQYWAGTGTLGLICYLGFLSMILLYAWRGFRSAPESFRGKMELALLTALLCFMVGSLTESNFNIAKNRFYFLMIAGMAVAFARRDQSQN